MKNRYLVFIILFASCFSSASFADTGFTTKVCDVFSGKFPNISMMIKVFTKIPTTLLKDNFEVFEDGQKISKFSIIARKPMHYIILVIDRSSSIKPAMNEIKKAACIFIKNMPENFKIAIISFGSDVDIEQDFTTDKTLLQKRVWKIRPYGGTSLYDAVFRASELLQQTGKRIDIKTIICLTDGRDCNPSGTKQMSIKSVKETIVNVKKCNARIISLGLGKDIDAAILTKMSKSTNGAYLPVLTPEKLPIIYQKLGKRLRLEQYLSINYTSPDPKFNGTLRKISINSIWQGLKEQGTGKYRAPVPPPPEQKITDSIAPKKRRFTHTTLEASYIEFHYVPMVKEKFQTLDRSSVIAHLTHTNNRFADELSIIDKEPGKWLLVSSKAYTDRRTIQPGKPPLTDKEIQKGARVDHMEKFYIHGKAKILTGVEEQ